MPLTLRQRILLTLLPIFLLLAAIGTAGVVLLLRVGQRHRRHPPGELPQRLLYGTPQRVAGTN